MAIDDFDKYLGKLKTYLPDVEDASFSWADVIGLLVIKLRNTDSLNKARTASHATQIQLTSESGASEGKRKTEDFFPTLTLNSSFKSWRIAIPTRIHRDNILQLDSNDKGITEKWIDDSIQIRRRILNEDGQGNGNPALQICYGNDLMPLRELLNVDDYIVVVKRKNSQVYEAFGVRSDVDLGSGKQLYVSTKASNDKLLHDLQLERRKYKDEQIIADVMKSGFANSNWELVRTRVDDLKDRQYHVRNLEELFK